MDSFTVAVTAYVQASKNAVAINLKTARLAAIAVAIGFLGKMSKTDINNAVRREGDFSDDAWKSVKVPLSHAWRAIAGEYGFGEQLAMMWAKDDYSITLDAAYKASKPPADAEQVIESLVKSLLTLNDEDRATVISRVQFKLQEQQENDSKRPERFTTLFASLNGTLVTA